MTITKNIYYNIIIVNIHILLLKILSINKKSINFINKKN